MGAFLVALTIILSALGYYSTLPTVCVPVTERGDIACFERVVPEEER